MFHFSYFLLAQIQFTSTVPQGCRGGDTTVVVVNGVQGTVVIPAGLSYGQMFRFNPSEMQPIQNSPLQQVAPQPLNQQQLQNPYIAPQQNFSSNFQPPQQQPVQQNQSPATTEFFATVPPGILPGQPFEVIVNGMRVQLVCPPGGFAGMQFTGQIPVQPGQNNIQNNNQTQQQHNNHQQVMSQIQSNYSTSTPPHLTQPPNMYAPEQHLYAPPHSSQQQEVPLAVAELVLPTASPWDNSNSHRQEQQYQGKGGIAVK